MDKRPIGIFDSGLGGLTVVKEIKKLLPDESLVYLGDTARVPYGTRSKATVTKFALQDSQFLSDRGVKCIVIACNTASAAAAETVRAKADVPVFDVIVAGAQDAVKMTKNKKIGVIGTRATIASNAYKKAIRQLDTSILVYGVACPLFVSLVEEGEIKGKLISLLAKKYLAPIKKAGVDTLILGCTHFPIIRKIIAHEVGSRVALVNPAEVVVEKLASFLKKEGLRSKPNSKAKKRYYVTDLTPKFVQVAEMFLGEKIIKGKIRKISLD